MGDNKPQPEEFDNPNVLNAFNPHPEWGYMHGKLVSLCFNVHWPICIRSNQKPKPYLASSTPERRSRAILLEKKFDLGLLRSPPDQPLNLFAGHNSLVYVCIFTAGFSYAYWPNQLWCPGRWGANVWQDFHIDGQFWETHRYISSSML